MLTLNYAHCLSDSIGIDHGLMEPEIFGLQSRLQEAHNAVARMGASGKLGFIDLPNQSEEAKRIMAWAKKTRSSFDTLVVLGIGGSALGNNAIQQALRSPYWNLKDRKERKGGLRLFVLDNVDPRWTAELLEVLDLRKTLFNVISKSGTTAEILSNYFFFRKAVEAKVGVKKAPRHFVITTNEQKRILAGIGPTGKHHELRRPWKRRRPVLRLDARRISLRGADRH